MKNKIKSFSLAIFAMVLAAPVFATAATTGVFDPKAGGATGLPDASISEIIVAIMDFLLMAVGIIGVIGFAIAGILYLTAAGDEKRIDQAKSAMLYSIIGVIVAIAGVVALTAAKTLLGGDASF